MQKNKIVTEKGHTIIVDNKTSKEPNIKRANSAMLDEMQSVFDRVERDNQSVFTLSKNESQATPNNMNYNTNGLGQSNIMSILPLLAGLGGKNMSNLSSIMSSLPNKQQNNSTNMNLISQLLPLLQNMKSFKKNNKNEIQIDSLTKADDH